MLFRYFKHMSQASLTAKHHLY